MLRVSVIAPPPDTAVTGQEPQEDALGLKEHQVGGGPVWHGRAAVETMQLHLPAKSVLWSSSPPPKTRWPSEHVHRL